MHWAHLSANGSLTHVHISSKMVINDDMCNPSIQCFTHISVMDRATLDVMHKFANTKQTWLVVKYTATDVTVALPLSYINKQTLTKIHVKQKFILG